MIKRAFITRVNKPKVIKVIGKVKIKSIGLITAFIIPKTSAVAKAAVKLVTCTPGRRYEAASITIADKRKFTSIAIFISIGNFVNCWI